MISSFNWIAIFAATLLQFVVGFAWYSSYLFGKKYLRLTGKTAEAMKAVGVRALMGNLVTAFISATVLSFLVYATGTSGFFAGAWLGGLVSVGFVATTAVAAVLYEGQKPAGYLITAGYNLVALMLAGGLLALWQ